MFAHQFLFSGFFSVLLCVSSWLVTVCTVLYASSPPFAIANSTSLYRHISNKYTKKIRRGKTIILFFNETTPL